MAVRRESLEDQRRDARYPFATTPPATRRHRYRVALVLVLLLVPVTIVARDRFATTTTAVGTGRPIEFHSFAYPDAPWVSELYAARWPEQYHPSRSWKSADVTTRYLNVHDGVRRSWTPAHPQFEVWFLGGSALYGLGQRDDHSIPSEVARLSAGSGLPIKAINLGVPGYDQWQEQAVMAERLSRGEHPDLVVFYDGANDLTAMEKRATEGIEPLAEPPNRFQQDIEDVTGYPHETRGAPASDAQLQAAFLKVYGAGLDLATRTAAAYGVPTAFYWQPEYYSTKPSKADGPLIALYPELAPANVSGERALRAAIRSKLPPTVVDLGASLDDVPRPTFFDPVHTNEQGARGVAEAMWPSLRQKLLAIAGTAEHPPS